VAKARKIQGLSAGEPYATAAATIVGVRSDELIEHVRGVLDVADIERVHDMRVATRRLRAALEIFGTCFPRGELKAALREVKTLADALGQRRDRDVAIAALEAVAAAMAAADRPGIETLVARLREEQQAANDALAEVVAQERLDSLSDRLAELVASIEPVSGAEDAAHAGPAWLPRRETAPTGGAHLRAVEQP
jgi:CHAD domain-containing protein